MAVSDRDIQKVRDAIGVGVSVATELLVLGDDPDLVIKASRESDGLDQCKANVIDKRFRRLEYGESYGREDEE